MADDNRYLEYGGQCTAISPFNGLRCGRPKTHEGGHTSGVHYWQREDPEVEAGLRSLQAGAGWQP